MPNAHTIIIMQPICLLYTSGDSVPAWAQSSVDALYEIGVIDTAGGEMRANDTLTRADAAQILYNVMTLIYE